LWPGDEPVFAASLVTAKVFEFVETGYCFVLGISFLIQESRRLDETRTNYAAAPCTGFQFFFNSSSTGMPL
jgi:hypothetical protein